MDGSLSRGISAIADGSAILMAIGGPCKKCTNTTDVMKPEKAEPMGAKALPNRPIKPVIRDADSRLGIPASNELSEEKKSGPTRELRLESSAPPPSECSGSSFNGASD